MLTLEFVGMVGEARKYALTDAGYADIFVVSNAELKSDPENAVKRAIAEAMGRYRASIDARNANG